MTSDDFPFTKKIGAKRLRKMEEKERRKEAREVITIAESVQLFGELKSVFTCSKKRQHVKTRNVVNS